MLKVGEGQRLQKARAMALVLMDAAVGIGHSYFRIAAGDGPQRLIKVQQIPSQVIAPKTDTSTFFSSPF